MGDSAYNGLRGDTVPEPLNYRNAKFLEPPTSASEPAAAPPAHARAAIPVEFDVLLTRSPDHAAVGAIVAALQRQKIPFFRTDDPTQANRPAELYIHAADQERAAQIAAGVFVRRRKVKAMPPVEMPQDRPSTVISAGVLNLWTQ